MYMYGQSAMLLHISKHFILCLKVFIHLGGGKLAWASQVEFVVKNPSASAGDMTHRFNPCVGKIPWRRAWQHTLVFLLGESHGQRSLAGYSPWGGKVRYN